MSAEQFVTGWLIFLAVGAACAVVAVLTIVFLVARLYWRERHKPKT